MKAINWIVLLAATAAMGGCASRAPQVTGTEGLSGAALEAMADKLDSDGDSISDVTDTCADTATGALVDEVGCEVSMGVIDGLSFGVGAVDLPANASGLLERYVDVMKRYPDLVVSIEGHTDNRGPAAANIELSTERVLSVARFMIAGGIDPVRVKLYGHGESRPRAANATSEGREQNRRIEIIAVEGLL